MASSSSSSSARLVGALLHRSPISLPTTYLPRSKLGSIAFQIQASEYGFLGRKLLVPATSELGSFQRGRRIWTSVPLCMGRRACKIADRKGTQNAKKMKRNGKIGKEIVSAIKRGGGPNPASNTILAAVLERAKQLDVPKEIVERNLKKALEKGQEAYIEKVYEIYGFGGASMVVDVSTDKITRSVQAIRQVIKESGAKMADSGSVMFKFRRARVVNVKAADVDKDALLSIALDAGAEDVIEPTIDDEDYEEDNSERYYKVVCMADNYSEIQSKLQDEGIKFEPDNGYELLPLSPIEVDDEAMDLNKEMISKLLDLDDVDAVYTDQK